MSDGMVTGLVSTTYLAAGESVWCEITDQVRELEAQGYVQVREREKAAPKRRAPRRKKRQAKS